MLLQIFLRNFYSNASCFSLVWLYLGNSQVSVDRTIGPTLVLSFHIFFHSISSASMRARVNKFCKNDEDK